MSVATGESFDAIEARYDGQGYGQFKGDVGRGGRRRCSTRSGSATRRCAPTRRSSSGCSRSAPRRRARRQPRRSRRCTSAWASCARSGLFIGDRRIGVDAAASAPVGLRRGIQPKGRDIEEESFLGGACGRRSRRGRPCCRLVQPERERGQAPRADKELKHVFVIMLENHSKRPVIGDPGRTDITSLANTYAVARSTTGSRTRASRTTSRRSRARTGRQRRQPEQPLRSPNLVDQLDSAGKTWGAYMESMPSAGYLGNNSGRGRVAANGAQLYARSTTRSCSSRTSATTRPGSPTTSRTRRSSTISTTTRRTSSSSFRTSATTCTEGSAPSHRPAPTARRARSRTPRATRTISR